MSAGRRTLPAQGYAACGLRSVTDAAGLPHSSFSSHFSSKEAFGLEILELYFAEHHQLMRRTLRNDALAPPLRLRSYFDALLRHCDGDDDPLGAAYLMGKLCAESQGIGELMRTRLVEMLLQIRRSLAYCLSAGAAAGVLPPHTEAQELAAFMLTSLQGALLAAKLRRDAAPLLQCAAFLLQMLGW